MGLKQDQTLEKARALTISLSAKAKADALKSGLNVLFRRGNFLICRKPDGSETEIKELRPRVSGFPTDYNLS
ncbi:hypothetical protein [Leptospira noguchii]|uniref:Uncharacterized protein n=1 Tax=Leptospira noguchii serovar Panama str. CZ214 TaxID=1001595 RepID=T0GWF3_9LEPT|nr:hypothetical protein [Leptospira noguchii]EQA71641.1 hypothetical protein LEP1GSC059_1135 [Leptospira noguchii serovar Panama str. CZ214]